MNSTPSSSALENGALSPLSVLHAAILRLASQSAACKIVSVVLAAAALLFSLSRNGGPSLLWAAAPAALLALVDAGYAGRARNLAVLARTLSPKDPHDLAKSIEFLQVQTSLDPAGGIKALRGLLSMSIWPFYLGLAGLVIGAETGLTPPAAKFPTSNVGVPYASLPSQYRPNSPGAPNGSFPQPYRPNGNMAQTPAVHPPLPQGAIAPASPSGSPTAFRPQAPSFGAPSPVRAPMPKAPPANANLPSANPSPVPVQATATPPAVPTPTPASTVSAPPAGK